jgi:hypothetical protein
MTERDNRGRPSRWRPKVYDRRISAVLTRRGWELMDEALESEQGSIGDWIETRLRQDAGEQVQ